MVSRKNCPSESKLHQFNQGCLSDREIDAIGDHLAQCSTCFEKLEGQTPGDLEQNLHRALISPTAVESESDDVLARKIVDMTRSVDPGFWSSPPGNQLFALQEKLGAGQLASAWLAEDLVGKKKVVVKLPHQNLVSSGNHCAQFLKDAKLAASLDHEHILKTFKFGMWDESLPYCVTEVAPGVDLTAYVKAHPPSNEALTVFRQVCVAIRHGHRRKILHRNLRPNNVFVDGTQAKVADFGMIYDARYQFGLVEPMAQPSRFASPESSRNDVKKIDRRADVFSLGALLHWLLGHLDGLDSRLRARFNDVADQCRRVSRRQRPDTVDQLLEQLPDVGQ